MRARNVERTSRTPIVEQLRRKRFSAAEIRSFATGLTERESAALLHDWGNWRHGGQIEPAGDWRSWLIMAGRGHGKTRAGSEWIKAAVARAAKGEAPPFSIALVAATIDEGRRIMVSGTAGLLRVAAPYVEKWRITGNVLEFKGGSQATLFSGANPDGLRGPEHHLAWCDELAKWEKAEESWDNLQLGLRLRHPALPGGPRVLVTTTPQPGAILERIRGEPDTVETGGTTHANIHLSEAYVHAVERMYGGTRLGRQELEGELLTDTPGALWSVELLERQRSPAPAPDERFELVVIGVDPPAGAGTCGIVACGRSAAGQLHVLGDHSIGGVTPAGWAAKVVAAADEHGARYVIAEDNQGGAMVGQVLKDVDRQLTVRPVRAKTSKSARATPVSVAFEQGRAWLRGSFPELEAQLCGLIGGGGYAGPGRSPDRADAMVWALTELTAPRSEARMRFL